MSLAGLLPLIATNAAVAGFLADLDIPGTRLAMPYGPRPALLALAAEALRADAAGDRTPPALVAVTATSREAEDLAASLAAFVAAEDVAVFPSWETLPHERMSPSADVVGRRTAVLRRLRNPGGLPGTAAPSIVVAPVRALLQPMVAGLADMPAVELVPGAEADPVALARDLVHIGY